MTKNNMDYFLIPNSNISDQITNTIKRRNDSLITDDKLILKDISRGRIGFVNLNVIFENKYEAFFELNDKPLFTGKRHCLNDGYRIKNHWSRYCGAGFCCNLVFKDIRDAAALSLKNLEFQNHSSQLIIKGYTIDYTSEYESHYLSRDFMPTEIIALGCSICLSRDPSLTLKAVRYTSTVKLSDSNYFYPKSGLPVCEECSLLHRIRTVELSEAVDILSEDNLDKEPFYYIKYYSVQSLLSEGSSGIITKIKTDNQNHLLEFFKKKKINVFKANLDSLTLLNVESHKSPINPDREFDSMDEFLVYQNLLAKDEFSEHFYDFSRYLKTEVKNKISDSKPKKKRLAWI